MNRNEKVQIIVNSTRSTLLVFADFLYILAFGLLTVYEFLGTVQLKDDQRALWRELESGRPQWVLILLAIVILQYLCSKDYNWQEYVVAVGVLFLGFKACPGNETMLIYILLLVGARRFSFKKLMWLYLGIILSLTAFTVVGSQMGWVENLVFDAGYRGDRSALGFVYATDGAAHFIFLAMAYWCVRGRKMCFLEGGFFGVLAYITGKYCKARFSTGLLITVMILALVYWIAAKVLGEKKWDKVMGGWFSAFLVTMPLLTNLLIHILSFFYTPQKPWMATFNQLVSTRLSLAKTALDVYGVTLWGNKISMRGNGGRTTTISDYYYIDSSYLQISMLEGVVLLAILLAIFTMACLKARRAKMWIPLLICSVITVHAMFEHHAFQLAYNPFLLMAFADLQPKRRRKKLRKIKIERLENLYE